MTATEARPALADWGAALTCYTAALGVHLAAEQHRWWRPLLEGGPHLGLTPAGDGLLRFEHHPRPPARLIGLRAAWADDWEDASARIEAELDEHRRVVVAADGWNVPWLTSHGKEHAPHWFVLRRDERDGYVVDDPLELVHGHGRQAPVRVRLAGDEVRRCCGALVDPRPEHALREQATLGATDTGLGRRFRWLVRAEPRTPPPGPAVPDEPLLLLAERIERDAADPGAYAQVDDVWQAQRQRELMVRALDVEAALGEVPRLPPAEPWRRVAELWRRLPPLLMHARLLARSGARGTSADALVETLRAIAGAEAALVDHRFPAAA